MFFLDSTIVVHEDECVLVVRVDVAGGPFVTWAKVTRRIVFG